LQAKRFLLLAGCGLLTILCSGIITLAVLSIPGMGYNTHVGWQERMWMIIFLALLAGVHGIIGTVMRGFISWYGDIRIKAALQQKNHETELALVKSQLNPHFLFNTIHNIDVLIEKNAAQASLYLNKLSDIMRFMLYEAKTEQIPLSRELAYIERYIDLQKIRTANTNYVQYHVTGNAGNLMIAPLLFIPISKMHLSTPPMKRTPTPSAFSC
jgi:sensor histidine kinase YesM